MKRRKPTKVPKSLTSLRSLGLVLFLAGAACATKSGYEIWANAPCAAWPTTLGTITRRVPDGSSYPDFRVRYEYEVDGRLFKSSRIVFSLPLLGRSDDRDEYPEGRKVTVYYNPSKPSQALLDPSLDRARHDLMETGGMMFMGIVAYIGYLALRHRMRTRGIAG